MESEKRLLIAAGDRCFTAALAERCAAMNVRTQIARDRISAMREMTSQPPTFVLIDGTSFADPGLLARDIRADESLQAIPRLVLTEFDRAEGMSSIVRKVRTALGAESPTVQFRPQPTRYFGRALLIDGDRAGARQLARRMWRFGVELECADDAFSGFDRAVQTRPDVILTEFLLPKGTGAWVLGRLRDCEIETPVVFVTESDESGFPHLQSTLLELGAAAVMAKPVAFAELMTQLQPILQLPVDFFERAAETLAPRVELRAHGAEQATPHLRLPAPATASLRGIAGEHHEIVPRPKLLERVARTRAKTR